MTVTSGKRCETCGTSIRKNASPALCTTCYAATHTGLPADANMPTGRARSAVWLWSAPEASAALASRDLGAILRTYRRLNNLSQPQLAALLAYDPTYISMLETGRRALNDVPGRRHIAHVLGLPAHALGVTDRGDADFAAMIQFADSTIRLAEIARRAGRAVDAVNELWPLVARLEARAAGGHLERDILILLGQARVALGVSLGTVLPEERLSTAAAWTGRALTIARHLDDPVFLAHALRMHGNELRKANHTPAAIHHLHHAVHLSDDDPDGEMTALAFLARATGEHGDREAFDHAINRYRGLLDIAPAHGMLANPFTFREIHLRGLAATGRTAHAIKLMHTGHAAATPAAPQWHIIERVTAGQIHHAAGDHDSAVDAFRAALTAAEHHQLPHQIQRAIRTARDAGLHDLANDASDTLARVSNRFTPPRTSLPHTGRAGSSSP
jgi:transcriptional regulator with XRE-family HTH domain